jgi:L-lactate dehydrogenase (cytochrome)
MCWLMMRQISTNASYPAAEIIEQAPDYPFLFQLYVNKDRKKSEELVRHVEELGVKAIFVTVDAAGRGKRESDERLRVDEVAFNPLTGEKSATGKKGGGLTKTVGAFIDQGLTWEDLKWLRSLTKLPILLKGIMTAEDAKLAMHHKVDGILLSNHGGKSFRPHTNAACLDAPY